MKKILLLFVSFILFAVTIGGAFSDWHFALINSLAPTVDIRVDSVAQNYSFTDLQQAEPYTVIIVSKKPETDKNNFAYENYTDDKDYIGLFKGSGYYYHTDKDKKELQLDDKNEYHAANDGGFTSNFETLRTVLSNVLQDYRKSHPGARLALYDSVTDAQVFLFSFQGTSESNITFQPYSSNFKLDKNYILYVGITY